MVDTNDMETTETLRGGVEGSATKALLTAALVVVYFEAFLWTTTRVFFLNFTTAGPNATSVFFLLLVTGWSLALFRLIDVETRTVYLGALVLLVVGFAVSLSASPAVAALGGVAVVTSVTPMLVGLLDDLRGGFAAGFGVGVILAVGLRTILDTASPYATTMGTVLLSGFVLLCVVLTLLVYRDGSSETDLSSLTVSPAPLGVFLIVSASFFAYPHTVARWELRSYGFSVVAVVVGVLVGLGVVSTRGTPSLSETAVWGVVFLAGVGAFLYVPHPVTTAAYGVAWACAVVLLSTGSRRAEGAGTGALSLSVFQLIAVLALFGVVSATNWPFMPSPLDGARGLATEMLFVLHAVFPISVGYVVLRHAETAAVAEGTSVSRRAVLSSAAVSLLPLGGVLSVRTGRGEEPSSSDGETEPIRVMAYNLHLFLEGGESGQYNLEEALSVIEEDDPDIIGVLESDGCRATSGNVDGVEWLGEKLGYDTAFGAPTSARTPGVSVLSRWPIENVEYVELPISRSPTRVVTLATVRTPNGPTRIAATHFMTAKEGDVRDQQAEALVDTLEDEDDAVILGDFNVVPDREEPAYRILDDAFDDAWVVADETVGGPETWSASDPVRRIDYVFLKGDWRVSEAEVSGNPRASDHLAVSADIEPETRG